MSLSRRRFLQATGVALGSAPLRHPLALWAQRDVGPAPGMPAPRFVDTNGIRMGVYDQGEGLPVVFAHGFPELAYSWRHQLPAFASAGFRAIAPDMRGYGLTSRPAPVDAYTVRELCADLVGLLDALSIERAVFCGHDWGGMPAWTMPRLYPERVAGVIGVNTPAFGPAGASPPPIPEEPLIVRTENYYTNTFQPPGQAEAILQKDVRRSLEVFFCRGWYWDVETLQRFPPDSAERTMDFLRMIEEGKYLGEPFMTEAEIGYYTRGCSATKGTPIRPYGWPVSKKTAACSTR